MENKPEKLQELLDIEDIDSLDALFELSIRDTVCPGICMNEDCSFVVDYESDQDAGWCIECETNTVVSALVLAGLI